MLQAMAKKIHVVAGGRDSGHQRPYRHMRRWRERYVEEGYDGIAGPAAGLALASPGGGGDGGEGVRVVPGKVFRSERAALSRSCAALYWMELSYTWVKQVTHRERAWWRAEQKRGA